MTTDYSPRLLAVSDIHGHGEGLLLLLREAGYDPRRDRLFLLGDYVDADPSTRSTLEIVHSLARQGAVALPGNLEVQLLRNDWTDAPGDVRAWLGSLPYYATEDEFLFVHAGIRRGLPPERQSIADMTEIREEFWAHAPEPGRTVVFGHTPTFKLGAAPGSLWLAPGRIGIDTGAKHGHRLTLLDLRGDFAYSCSTAPANRYGDVRSEPVRTRTGGTPASG
ncbi:MAG: metallophosphoesterase [Paenibacillaceae bacterium]|nr:metallophosphoesterase [Paenibacillaceae bacterium]